jgi:lipopolysaccharide transport system permease protein
MKTNNSFLSNYLNNKFLVYSFLKREIIQRYKGSFFGLIWSILNPLFMLLIYTFIFSEVFNVRWESNSTSKIEFGLMIFSGLMIFNIFSDCLSKSPYLILNNSNYVKKIIFPTEILVYSIVGSALFHFLVNLIVFGGIYFFTYNKIQTSIFFFLPLIIFSYLLFIMGICLVYSALTVFVRDFANFNQILITIFLFASPIFYPISMIPENYHFIFNLNPLSFPIESFRNIVFFNEIPQISSFFLYLSFSILIFSIGVKLFMKLRPHFPDFI